MDWTRFLWSVMDTSVLVVTCIYKFPQVAAVMTARSSAGISMPSLMLEFTSYTIEMTYQTAMGYPFTTYYESCLMWSQDIVLVYVVLESRGWIGMQLLLPLCIYFICFASIINWWLPDLVMYSLILSTTPVLITSKAVQLWQVLSTRDPGRLSALTWGLVSYVAGARVLTAMFITGDIPLFFNNFSSCFMDLAVTFSIIYYNSLKRQPRRSAD